MVRLFLPTPSVLLPVTNLDLTSTSRSWPGRDVMNAPLIRQCSIAVRILPGFASSPNKISILHSEGNLSDAHEFVGGQTCSPCHGLSQRPLLHNHILIVSCFCQFQSNHACGQTPESSQNNEGEQIEEADDVSARGTCHPGAGHVTGICMSQRHMIRTCGAYTVGDIT